jgi:D-alanine-D-alanine ligase
MSERARDDGPLRVLLLYGGRSAEHDVSRVSAVAVAKALDPARFRLVPVGIDRDGRWWHDPAITAAAVDRDRLGDRLDVGGDPVALLAAAGGARVVRLDGGAEVVAPDVVVPLLHGPHGEDGTVQGLCEMADLPYVGAGVLGSAVGMDKAATKQMAGACGVPTVAWLVVRATDGAGLAERVAADLGFPCFVKPANMGSSVGVVRVADREGLGPALARAGAYDDWVLVEEAVVAREIEVAVLGDPVGEDLPRASVPGEIVPGAEFYTYEDKYLDGAADLRAPADLDPGQADEVRALALATFAACRCDGMARVDFFLEERRADGRPGRGFLLNEINTIPGFTPISMFPRLWELSGLAYPALVERLVARALARHARRTARDRLR